MNNKWVFDAYNKEIQVLNEHYFINGSKIVAKMWLHSNVY